MVILVVLLRQTSSLVPFTGLMRSGFLTQPAVLRALQEVEHTGKWVQEPGRVPLGANRHKPYTDLW